MKSRVGVKRLIGYGSVLIAGMGIVIAATVSGEGRQDDVDAAIDTTRTLATAKPVPVARAVAEATVAPPSAAASSMTMPDAIRAIQNAATTKWTANGTQEPHAGETSPALPDGFSFDTAATPASAPRICTTAKRIICADKTTYVATAYINGAPQFSFPFRPGDGRGGSFATGDGHGRIDWKSRHHVSSLYGTPMPYAMFIAWDKDSRRGQVFHLSYDFQREGYDGFSHGCMGVGSEAVMQRMWETFKPGDKVYTYRS
ncbi:L,D-transpeptidase family protein [Paraburkholderia sp. A3BS-1L]|uniref:L,D-transpeptidase n=1 Tax=Paraburkholderia sp. A3BS-1L TaxID=3028375 RepID=UPI003DAA3E63